jgi:hypothetical protein
VGSSVGAAAADAQADPKAPTERTHGYHDRFGGKRRGRSGSSLMTPIVDNKAQVLRASNGLCFGYVEFTVR